MKYQAYDKYEYKFVNLSTSLQRSIEQLNKDGSEGWEVIDLEKPKVTGELYKALLKRKLTEVEL